MVFVCCACCILLLYNRLSCVKTKYTAINLKLFLIFYKSNPLFLLVEVERYNFLIFFYFTLGHYRQYGNQSFTTETDYYIIAFSLV